MEPLGEKAYFEIFLKKWRTFKEKGGIKGLELAWD